MFVPMFGFGQNIYQQEETKWSKDSTRLFLKSDNKPITGIVQTSSNGKESHEIIFDNGFRISCKGYYKNGQLDHEKYSNGWSSFFRKNGKLEYEGNFKDGFENGVWKYYNKKEELKKEIVWDMGIESEVIYKNGKKVKNQKPNYFLKFVLVD